MNKEQAALGAEKRDGPSLPGSLRVMVEGQGHLSLYICTYVCNWDFPLSTLTCGEGISGCSHWHLLSPAITGGQAPIGAPEERSLE